MGAKCRPRGPMDKTSAYGAGDWRFESCRGRSKKIKPCYVAHFGSGNKSGKVKAIRITVKSLRAGYRTQAWQTRIRTKQFPRVV